MGNEQVHFLSLVLGIVVNNDIVNTTDGESDKVSDIGNRTAENNGITKL